MKPNLVIFGGTGGLGTAVTPLLEKEFTVSALGSSVLDISNTDMIKRFFDKEGYIANILYMAVVNHDAVIHKLEKYTAAHQVRINIQGFLDVLRYGLPLMRENNYGRIIYMSSILSERPIPGTGIYSATKAFNDNIVRTCALENAKYNITCNSLQLGYFNAGLTRKVPQDILAKVLDRTPMRRLGNEEDLYKAIKFILDSPYLTGVNLPLSGGLNIA